MFNNEVIAASHIQGTPALDAIVCPGTDQRGKVAEGKQEAFLCSRVLKEGLYAMLDQRVLSVSGPPKGLRIWEPLAAFDSPSQGSQHPTTLLTNSLINLVLTENLLQMTKRSQLF